ncbi:MAG: hypothetical protein WCT04_07145 [Planctomycetota bacterium]
MQVRTAWSLVVLAMALSARTPLLVAAVPNPEVEQLKAQVNALSDKLKILEDTSKGPQKSAADTALDGKFGPNLNVTTAKGKLQIGGLVQVWYTNFQHDRRGLFDKPFFIDDSNTAGDNDSFRIRRTELRFSIDVHEHVSAFVMIDPAAEAASYPQGAVARKSLAYTAPQYPGSQGVGTNGQTVGATLFPIQALQLGLRTSAPTLLQDALINFHSILPHHDITVGQMLNTFNEDNFANSGSLDFVERAYISNSVSRDMGAVLHGSWWCNGNGSAYQGAGDSGRVQYWLGIHNGTGNLLGTAGSSYNRSDDNNNKDFIGTLLLRPLWDECYGNLEMGYSFRAGHHGNSGMGSLGNNNNFVGANTSSLGHDGWMKYSAPGCLKGLWVKGEATWLHDRNAPGSVVDLFSGDFQLGNRSGFGGNPEPFSTFGYWGAIGYKFAESPLLGDCKESIWSNFEIAFRFESAPNVYVAKPDPHFTSVYSSKVYTAGINYYVKGDTAKIQLNYNAVQTPDGPNGQPFHHTKSDSLALSFQVMW